VIRAALARYELSVEQFPHYLAAIHGAERMLSVLQGLESEPLTEQELRSLQVLRFWSPVDGGSRGQGDTLPLHRHVALLP
jgi:hypothetical protein